MNPLHSVIAGDSRKHRARRRSDAVVGVIEELERRVFLSGTLTPIFSLNGADGSTPVNVVEDSSGNLFGITFDTIPNGDPNANPGPGVLFEVPANTSTVNDLYTFSDPSGVDALPNPSSLIIDSYGNLYGTVASGIVSTPDTVFELPVGTTTPITIATFAAGESGSVTAVDSAGNVYGLGGSQGGVFQIVHNSGMITPLADVTDQFQQSPIDLRLGPDGNLYGVTAGGISSSGPNPELFEITPSNDNLQGLAAFDPTTTGYSPIGLTFDSSGNVWGFCQNGGLNDAGTVWEMPLPVTSPTPSISLIAPISSDVGYTITSRPAFGTSGYLYGITENGGANGNGTVFALQPGDTTLTDIYDWGATASDPGLPEGFITNNSGFAQDTVPISTTILTGEDALFDKQITPEESSGGYAGPVYEPLWESRNLVTKNIDTVYGGNGAEVIYGPRVGPLTPAQQKARDELDAKRHQSEAKMAADERIKGLTYQAVILAGIDALASGGPSGQSVNVGTLADTQADTATTLGSQFAAITEMLAETTKELAAAGPLLSKFTAVDGRYTKEGTTITALNAQLAAQSNTAKQAAIQEKITADQAIQANLLTQDDANGTATDNELTNIETLETNITAAFAALPAPFAELTGGITSVPALINPGKNATAILTVTNSGNAPLTLSFQLVLSARPQGTTGSADVTLATDTIKLHVLKPNVPIGEHLSFLIPKTFPAGTYSLVAVPVLSSTLTGTATPVVSTTTFTVP